jgi:hypothetical protein
LGEETGAVVIFNQPQDSRLLKLEHEYAEIEKRLKAVEERVEKMTGESRRSWWGSILEGR